MIELFNGKTKYKDALLRNGLYQLDKLVIGAEVTEDIYGNYELNIGLDLTGEIPAGLFDMVQVDTMIKVQDEHSLELFRIAQVDKSLDEINIYARHITIADTLNLWLDNVKPTNANGMEALQHLARNTVPACNIVFSSDISTVNTADYVRKNLYEALFEGDNAFIKKWGGEVKRTGYTVRIDNKIGQDKTTVIKIKEALNLTEFDAKTNIDEVSTVIYPVGFDGITADRVVSKYVDNYSMEFPVEIKYEDVKVRKQNDDGSFTEGFPSLPEAQAELRRRAQLEFDKNKIDLIQFECEVDYVDLHKYEEYKDLAQLQRADLGDEVSVRVDTFNMDLKARIVARKYDVLRHKRIANTLSTTGELKQPIKIDDIIKDLVDNMQGAGVGDLSDYIDSLIQQGFKNGHVIYDKNAMYAVDTLPKEQAKNVVVVNKNGIGFSSTGIAGPYKYGFTIDGKINADMITTGSLSGQYIKGGSIEADKLSVAAKQEITQGLATSQNFIDLKADVDGVKSEVGQVKHDVKGVETNLSVFKQEMDRFQFEVKNTSTVNLLKNSRPRNFNKDFWYIGYNYPPMYRYFDGVDENTAGENFEGEVFKSGLWFTMWAPTVPEGWLFLANNSIRNYKFNTQKEYTLDFLLYSENSHTNIYIQIANDNGAHQLYYSGNIQLQSGYTRITRTFRPTEQGDQPNFMIVVNNRNGESINLYTPWVNLYEGHQITKQHIPDGRGLVDSLTTIDRDGVKCKFEDGTWASMGRDGFNYYIQGMTNPYKYINFTTKMTGIRNGQWSTITLPPCFLRKEIHRDFVVQTWAGAVDSDAFARQNQDAIRNLFIEIGNWNKETRQLQFRPCLQKIGVATRTFFGWDSATTSRGNPIGEGKIDVIILAQM